MKLQIKKKKILEEMDGIGGVSSAGAMAGGSAPIPQMGGVSPQIKDKKLKIK